MFALIGLVLIGLALIGALLAVCWARTPAPAGVSITQWTKDQIDGWRRGYTLRYDVPIRTRDQLVLMNNLYLPRGAEQKRPAILIRVPYNKNVYGESRRAARFFAARGFAVIIQDMRGRFASQGRFVPYTHAVEDGFDSLQWIIEQPWSNGRVGSFGCSALGEIQIITAKAPHPALKAMIVRGAGGAMGSAMGRHSYFGVYEGGVFNLATGAGWFATHDRSDNGAEPGSRRRELDYLPSVGVLGADFSKPDQTRGNYEWFLSTALNSPQWQALGYLSDRDRLQTPTLAFNSWYDPTVADSFVMAEIAADRATAPHHLIIGPGTHCTGDAPDEDDLVGDLVVRNPRAPDTNYPYWNQYLAWFSHWLLAPDVAKPLLKLPAYQVFVLGENRWLAAEQWPPAGSRQHRWSLSSRQGANSRAGDGVLVAGDQTPSANPNRAENAGRGFDEFRYDPNDPVPTRGGPVCCVDDPRIRAGAVDQTEVERRTDVLVYTSAALAEPLRIVGPLKARLTVSSSAKDTDLVARLVDVAPDGKTLNIQEGALRLRYRNGFAQPTLLVPGQKVSVEIAIRPTAYRLPKGHRLRLQITSSGFPRLERNLNTGGNNFDETVAIVAINRVWHERATDSYLEFFELPDAAVKTAP